LRQPLGSHLYAQVFRTQWRTTVASDVVSFRLATGDVVGADFADYPTADVLLYKASTGDWRLPLESGSGPVAGLWSPGWTIKIGDFNGDALSDLFFYNPLTGRAIKGINRFEWPNSNRGVFAFTEFAWSPGWTLTLADLNGDRREDVFAYNATNGRWIRCITAADGSFAYTASGVWSPNWSIYPADFNGDGRADLFLYNATNDSNRGRWFRVVSNPDETLTYLEGELRWSSDWTITPGDYDGDHRSDLFLYRTNGDWYRVTFPAGGTAYAAGKWSPGWTLAKGHFNNDRRADLFVYEPVAGRCVFVLSQADGTFSYIEGVCPPDGTQVATSDLDGDDRSDVLVYDPVSGWCFRYITTPNNFYADPRNYGPGWTLFGTRTVVP
jgi:hypothetical protein